MFGVLKGAPLYEISAQPKSSTKIITIFGLEVEKILAEKKENIKILIKIFSKIFNRKGSQNFQERVEAISNDFSHEISEVKKVLEFMKQESTRSFVSPKS